jgi:hypothetical protein
MVWPSAIIFCKRRVLCFGLLVIIITISDFALCSAVNLCKAAIISFYGTRNGSTSVQFHVMTEHNCHYCGAFTELH